MITNDSFSSPRRAFLFGALVLTLASSARAAEPVRVASLLPYVQDALGRLDGQVRLVATVRRELRQAPPAPIVDLGNPHSPSFERLAAADPQLVVGERNIHGPLRDRLGGNGAEVMLVESNSIDATFDGLMQVARRVGGEATMARAVAEARAGLAAEALAEPVPTLLLFGTPGSFMVVTDRTWLGDLLKRLNLTNVAAAVQGKESHPGFVTVSDEVLAGLRPDLVLLVAHGDETAIRAAFEQRTAAGGPLAALGKARRGVHVLPPRLFSANPGLDVTQAGRHLHGLATPQTRPGT
jgi:iron complex transport system substrate-binding protein